MTSRRRFLVTALATGGVLVAPRRHEAAPGERRAVVAYLFQGDAPIAPGAIDATRLTHINYAFANLRDGEVVEGFARDAENFRALAELRQRHPHLRVLVAVGGWTWSGGFSDAALTDASRQRFVRSAMAFLDRHDLDGVDIDWEYPGLRGNDNTNRPEDRENFTRVMADLRQALDDRKTIRGRVLTFAAGAFPAFIEHTQLDKVQRSIDFVNLMTYDFRVASVDPVAGHHANLFDHPADEKHRSGDRAVREFVAAGVPSRKIVLGVPFYGRGWTDVRAESNGLYQPGKALVEPKGLSYGRLSTEVVGRDGFVRHWDETARQPYLWNAEQRTFIAYDDPESVRLKARYITQHELRGAMFWHYGSDPTGALLGVLHAELSVVRGA